MEGRDHKLIVIQFQSVCFVISCILEFSYYYLHNNNIHKDGDCY